MGFTLPTALTATGIAAIAAGAHVRVDPAARDLIAAEYNAANRIAERQPVYGRSTGVGANRHTANTFDSTTHGMNLLRSHAVDAGPAVPAAEVRAMLAVRLNQLLHPGSGIEPSIIDGLERLLVSDSLPDIRRYGSIGTADLTALAATGLTLTGERAALGTPFTPIPPIKADSALPLMSSSALTIGGAALAAARLEQLHLAGLATFAVAALAAEANREAYGAEAAAAVGTPSAPGIAVTLNALLSGSTLTPKRIQDPFAFRGFLPGSSIVALASGRLSEAIAGLASRSQENPRFFSRETGPDAPGFAIHHGGFLETWLAHELDGAAIALAQAAPLRLSRVRFLNDDGFTGLPRFLSPAGGGSSGTMIVEYLAASALGEVQAAAAPVSVHSAVLSCGVEDDATFAPTSLAQLERALDGVEIMLACELVVATRALRLRGVDLDASAHPLLSVVAELPAELGDRDLRPDIDAAGGLLATLAEVADRLRAQA